MQLAMMLLFVAYFVSVQVNAAAYLAGTRRGIVGGTSPPVPLTGAGAAAADIAAGLLVEAIAAVDLIIAILLSSAAIRAAVARRRSRAAARDPRAP